MLIKINKKPIDIIEDAEEDSKSWILFAVKCVGYFFIFILMDYTCSTFLGTPMFTVSKFIIKLLGV